MPPIPTHKMEFPLHAHLQFHPRPQNEEGVPGRSLNLNRFCPPPTANLWPPRGGHPIEMQDANRSEKTFGGLGRGWVGGWVGGACVTPGLMHPTVTVHASAL